MRRFTTIMCSIAFMVSGIMMAISTSNDTGIDGYKSVSAATVSYDPNVVKMPSVPQNLLQGLNKNVPDTVYITKTDTIKEQVTMIKWQKASAPKPVVKTKLITKTVEVRDTIQVPVYYLATQTGKKEGPADQCVSVYEVHKVDEICPENINSSEP